MRVDGGDEGRLCKLVTMEVVQRWDYPDGGLCKLKRAAILCKLKYTVRLCKPDKGVVWCVYASILCKLMRHGKLINAS